MTGEATIKDSSVMANGASGVLAWKINEKGMGIVTIGNNVASSGNNPSGDGPYTDCDAAGGTFLGLPAERIHTM